MGRSARHLCAAHELVLLLCGATIFCAVASDVITDSSIPAFNADTDGQYQILVSGSDGAGFSTSFEFSASYNTTEGFVLLPQSVDFGGSAVQASFSTSFTLVAGAAPVSFVIASNNLVMALRGHDSANANTSLAFVKVSRMRSGCSCDPDYGLNVTVTPTVVAPGGRTVWIDFRAVRHRLYVYVAAAGEPRPLYHHLNICLPLGVQGRAPVGLFAANVGDIISGVRDWNFTVEVDKNPEDHSHVSTLDIIFFLVTLVIGLAAAIAITTPVVYLYFNSKYRRWKKEHDKLAKVIQDLPGVPTKVEFSDIKKATKNFHDTMKLGKGGFGAVYRCILPASVSRTGQAMEVAVKKFTQEFEDRRYDDFLAEVSIINRLRHKNIVPLVGWSYNKGVPVLVYEYMANGSLYQHLFRRGGHDRHDPMDDTIWQWDTRYNIVRDIATGLHYVHHEHEPMVLHRDIKASNIMLDSTFCARLGDFGIACTVTANKSYVTGIAGTFGYIAPDYAMSRKATRQTDIYAFGVLILEVVTGKKNADLLPDDDHITEWVWRLYKQGMLLETVDSVLIAEDKKQDKVILMDEAARLLLLGLACTNPNPSNRPSMVEVVQIINKLVPTPEVPLERPAFVWPPEDWRTRKSMYSTAMSDWEKSSASTMELVQFSLDLPPFASTREQASAPSEGSVTAIHTL